MVDARCENIRVRQEIRSMSPESRQRFFNAIKLLNSGAHPNAHDKYAELHIKHATLAHGDARFLPWHRQLLREFEKDLQRIDPGVTVPYWDWARDSADPGASPIFSSEMLGHNGGSGDCVVDGQFANWSVYWPTQTPHCLTRKFDRGNSLKPWWGTNAINHIKTASSDYDAFRRGIEGPHGNVHFGIGGDFTPMWSPNDPIFWLHHSFVDKLWADWQAESGNNLYSYGGKHSDGTSANLNEPLTPWGIKTGDAFNHLSEKYCYCYAPHSFTGDDISGKSWNGTMVEVIPEPLPEWWIKQQNMNVTDVRMFEADMAAAVREGKNPKSPAN
ncbi:hypothetical protein IWQ60_009845 [Tieghemiomyces parasiticus]|uniref:Tyrosinase copper-binding domain-containing protein n=1 Tax=Tieghemiomyces parasiticus TaxID=78921 RepID=A0A9W8DNV2_9FUNG|nr:hypothetical protein IWQ60_009845 [Tieghemiomyces parasiticus]